MHPGGPQAPLPSTPPPARGSRRAALRALAVCFTAALPLHAVAQACTPAPAVPSALVRPGAPWSALQAFMTQNGIAFTAGDSSLVIPCPARRSGKCEPMTARVEAEQRANCVTLAMVNQDSVRFLGLVRRYSGWDPANLGFGQPNPTNVVYLLVQAGQSLGIYRDSSGNVRTIPQSPTSWKFRFHPEDRSFAEARARWRPDSSEVSGLVAMREPHVRGGPSALFPDDGDVAQMAFPAYAWMTCAAGCCQFHGSGSGDDDDDVEGPKPPRPHPHPGNNPGPPRPRPR
jgi:hypothetical protein